jgi:hypothetical protein
MSALDWQPVRRPPLLRFALRTNALFSTLNDALLRVAPGCVSQWSLHGLCQRYVLSELFLIFQRHLRLSRLAECRLGYVNCVMHLVLRQVYDFFRPFPQVFASATDLIDPVVHAFHKIAPQFFPSFRRKK